MIDCFSDKTYIYGFVKETSYFSSINGVEDQLLRDYRVISNQYSFTMSMLVGSDCGMSCRADEEPKLSTVSGLIT